MASPATAATAVQTSTAQTALSYVKSVGSCVGRAYTAANQAGELQNKVVAATRTTLGIYSVAQFPLAAFTVGVVAAVKPKFSASVVKAVDGAVTGLWNTLSFNQKMVATAVGIAAVAVGVPGLASIANVLGTVFAAKIATELTVRNCQKEEVAAQVKLIADTSL